MTLSPYLTPCFCKFAATILAKSISSLYVNEEEIGSKILVQDYIVGNNITVDCVRSRKTGQKIQVQRREILRNSNGCGIAVKIIYNKKLEEICDELMERLDLNGVVNIEFFEKKQNLLKD